MNLEVTSSTPKQQLLSRYKQYSKTGIHNVKMIDDWPVNISEFLYVTGSRIDGPNVSNEMLCSLAISTRGPIV